MIKINKAGGYLIGFVLTLIIYFFGQLIFFINTEKANGMICDITESRNSGIYIPRDEFFYVCFTTSDNVTVKAKAGSNFKFDSGDHVTLRYKKNSPSKIRINEFSALWLMHSWPYIILWGFIMAAVTASWYGTKYVVISRNPFEIKFQNS